MFHGVSVANLPKQIAFLLLKNLTSIYEQTVLAPNYLCRRMNNKSVGTTIVPIIWRKAMKGKVTPLGSSPTCFTIINVL